MADTRMLLALDDSAASERALQYVSTFVKGRKGFRLCLVHVLPPLPPRLLEHGGAENSAREKRLDADLKAEQKDFISASKKAAQKSLTRARNTLRKAGVPAGALQALFCEPADGRDAADAILGMARECKCSTVVVGRKSVNWFHEMFSHDLPEEFLRRGKGFSVWVVE